MALSGVGMAKFSKSDRKRCMLLNEMLAPGRLSNVADVGARLMSVPAYAMLRNLGFAHIWGFEPDEEAFAALQALEQENATYMKQAIGQSGKAVFYRHPIGSISSVFPIDAASARFLGKFHWLDRQVKEYDMSLTALDDIDGMAQLDLLKMDLQGGELGVLQGGHKVLADAVAIIPEIRFHRMYEGEPLWADLDAEFRVMGFKLHKFMDAKQIVLPSPQKGKLHKRAGASQLLDGDAVYIRDLSLEDTPDDALKQLAIMADGVFQSFDLALGALAELSRRDVIEARSAQRYFKALPDAVKSD